MLRSAWISSLSWQKTRTTKKFYEALGIPKDSTIGCFLSELLHCHASQPADGMTLVSAYISRIEEVQKSSYHMTSDSKEQVVNSAFFWLLPSASLDPIIKLSLGVDEGKGTSYY